jgi:cytochrome c biogenesis protein CcmG, thiol:disulfide interchange protein DsbE
MLRAHRHLIRLFAALALMTGSFWASPSSALDAGTKLPEIGLTDLSGKSVTAASLAGKVVIVDFWATWCAPCREELPMLDKLYQKYRAQGLVVVGVSVDKDADNIRKFLGKLPLSFPITHDAEHQVSGRYQPPRMPSSYIVDKKGIVRFVHGGYRAQDAAEFESQIQRLLAK